MLILLNADLHTLAEPSLGKPQAEAPTTKTPPRPEKNDRDAPPVPGQRLSFTPIKSPEHKRVKLESRMAKELETSMVQVVRDFSY